MLNEKIRVLIYSEVISEIESIKNKFNKVFNENQDIFFVFALEYEILSNENENNKMTIRKKLQKYEGELILIGNSIIRRADENLKKYLEKLKEVKKIYFQNSPEWDVFNKDIYNFLVNERAKIDEIVLKNESVFYFETEEIINKNIKTEETYKTPNTKTFSTLEEAVRDEEQEQEIEETFSTLEEAVRDEEQRQEIEETFSTLEEALRDEEQGQEIEETFNTLEEALRDEEQEQEIEETFNTLEEAPRDGKNIKNKKSKKIIQGISYSEFELSKLDEIFSMTSENLILNLDDDDEPEIIIEKNVKIDLIEENKLKDKLKKYSETSSIIKPLKINIKEKEEEQYIPDFLNDNKNEDEIIMNTNNKDIIEEDIVEISIPKQIKKSKINIFNIFKIQLPKININLSKTSKKIPKVELNISKDDELDIIFYGNKNGVGTTHVAIALTKEFSKKGYDVGYIDVKGENIGLLKETDLKFKMYNDVTEAYADCYIRIFDYGVLDINKKNDFLNIKRSDYAFIVGNFTALKGFGFNQNINLSEKTDFITVVNFTDKSEEKLLKRDYKDLDIVTYPFDFECKYGSVLLNKM